MLTCHRDASSGKIKFLIYLSHRGNGASMNPTIRLATTADLEAINDIYNHYVLHATCTYQEEPEAIEQRHKWFDAHGEKHPVTVALMDDRIVGWGSLSGFHSRC